MCGIVGVTGLPNATIKSIIAIEALQHRGQEGAGVVSSDSNLRIYEQRGQGRVEGVFADKKSLEGIIGDQATAHVRYSTQGASLLKNVQPLVSGFQGYLIAVSHNGNLVNAKKLRKELESKGAIFQTTTDTEVIPHLMAHSKCQKLEDKLVDALRAVDGAYSLIVMVVDKNTNERTLFAARDPYGFRPLCMGEMNGAKIFASENCAFEMVNARYIRELKAGELVMVNSRGYFKDNIEIDFKKEPSKCVFEYIYLARPDSFIFGHPADVADARKNFGRQLAIEHPVDADIVIGVPDSGIYAALGYSEQSGIPYDQGLIRSHFIGRTFIDPTQSVRESGVRRKLNPVKSVLGGKRVVLVDDSIIRGTTSLKLINLIRDAGAKEVHFRISSPPTVGSCHYGIDTPDGADLIAYTLSVEDVRKNINADTLGYLSIEGLRKCQPGGDGYCNACFNREYPTPLYDKADKLS